MKKKICSLLLALLMVVTMLPVTAMATASNDYTQWRQGDSEWNQQEAWPASQYPGASMRWMRQAGCLVTSISMLLRHYNVVVTSDVNSFNPWICNNALKAAGAFTSSADMYWDGVRKAYPGFVYVGSAAYSREKLASLYSQGYACVVGVNGNGHYVAVRSADSSGAVIMDPGWGYTSLSSFSSVNSIYYYSATPSAHTCDKGSYVYYWDAHPHYKCYQCSICGKIWADKTETTLLSSCDECRPGKPALLNMQSTYETDTAVTFAWNSTSNTSHYNLWLYCQDDFGEWQIVERIFYAESGLSRTLSEGKYRVQLLSYNSEMWEADGSDWVHTYGDDCFFTVAKPKLASGTCGENLTWVLEENGTLTVSGAGEMYNYARDREPWKDYQSSITTVYIENGVSSIGDCAFESCEALTDVTIADSVTSIGKNAFACCGGLTSVAIPGSVTSIGVSAFAECANLRHLSIGNGVTNIAGAAFSDCTSLTEVVIPDSVSNIGSYAFEGDTNLARLSIGRGVKDIGKCAFDRCRSLPSVTIPDNVINIGEYAFEGATNLTSVTIGSGVANIGALAFVSCGNLTEFKVSNGNESYLSQNGVLFSKDGKKLISYPGGKTENYYTVPNGVETIDAFAFMYCTKLTEVTTGDSVTSVGLKAFYGCENLANVNLSDGITTIKSEAFSHCYNLININIPKTLRYIDQEIFSSCKNLTSIVIPDSVTEIRSGAFSGCSSLNSIAIPNGVVKIGWYVFQNCSALTHIEIPSTVTSIGTDAFNNCAALTDVYYSGTDTQWNAIEVLDGNASLKNATIHFAQPQPQPPVETSGTIAVSSVRARAGQTITVKVDLSANKGISNMRLQMSYPEGFTLESIQKGDALSTLFFTPPGKLTANPVNFVWDGTEADMSEGCILELTFRVADTVAVGEYSISLRYQKDDVLDGSLEGIDLALQSGTVSVVEFTRGDIDGDGVIGMKDLGALRKYFAGGYDAGNFVMEAADLDGDGVVTMKDLGVLRRYLAGGYDINLGE